MNFTFTWRKTLICLAVLIPVIMLAQLFGEYAHLVAYPFMVFLGLYLGHDEPELNGGKAWPLDARKKRLLSGVGW